jgi:hypothetical protein
MLLLITNCSMQILSILFSRPREWLGQGFFSEFWYLYSSFCGSESANFLSLVFCVLDNNIRKFKCVLSIADFTAQRLAMSLGLF